MQGLLHCATIAIVGVVLLNQLVHAVPTFLAASEVWLHLLEVDQRLSGG